MKKERVVALLGPSMIFFSEDGEASAMKGLQQAALEKAAPGVSWRCESHLLFPAPSMADRAGALVAAVKPDAAVLILSAFQLTHESVILRIKERWPGLYPAARFLMEKVRSLSGGGLEGSLSPRGWLFRLPKQLALMAVGGASEITPEAFSLYCKQALVALTRKEDLALICRLPVFYWRGSRAQERRARRKLMQVKTELVEYCRAHRIPAYDLEEEARPNFSLAPAADGVHFPQATRRFEAEVIARLLLDAGVA